MVVSLHTTTRKHPTMTKHIEGLTTTQPPATPLFAAPAEPERRVMLMAWEIGADGKLLCRWRPAYEPAPNLQA